MAEQASDFFVKPVDSAENSLRKLNRVEVAALGLKGMTIITDALAHTPTAPANGTTPAFCAIQAITNITISALAGSNITGAIGPTTTVSAGTIIPGFFTSVTLGSGTAIAYNL